MKKLASFSYELPYWAKQTYVIGIDEVGRGCLAGPVHVGGVCFPILSSTEQKQLIKLKIHDSKQCTEKKRDRLSPLIKKKAIAWSVQSSSVEAINNLGIVPALEAAASLVVQAITANIAPSAQIIVFTDSLPVKALKKLKNCPQTAIFKGDCQSISIAAASVIAKVERDRLMKELHTQFPAYAWNRNKGYATATHRKAVLEAGISPFHRTLYVRNVLKTSL